MPIDTRLLPPHRAINRYAALARVKLDLERVKSFCALITSHALMQPALAIAASWSFDAIGTAILIRYARCFDESGRDGNGVPAQVVEALPAELHRWHERVMVLRDQHAAHPVRVAETSYVRVEIGRTKTSGKVVVRGFAPGSVALSCIGSEVAEPLQRICDFALVWVGEEFQKEHAKVQEFVAGLGPDYLGGLPSTTNTDVPDWARIDREIERRRRKARR